MSLFLRDKLNFSASYTSLSACLLGEAEWCCVQLLYIIRFILLTALYIDIVLLYRMYRKGVNYGLL